MTRDQIMREIDRTIEPPMNKHAALEFLDEIIDGCASRQEVLREEIEKEEE